MAGEDDANCEEYYKEEAENNKDCMGGLNKSVFYFADINVTMGGVLLAGLVYYKMKQDCNALTGNNNS